QQNSEGDSNLAGDRIQLERMSFQIPTGWKVHQDALAGGMLVLGLTNGRDYMRIYVQQGPKPDMNHTFVNNNARITRQPHDVQYGAATWTLMETAKGQRQVAAFATEKDGFTYWGFASSSSGRPATIVQTLLQSSANR